MDNTITRLIDAYDRRSAEEWALADKLPPGAMFARRDEMLLAVGHSTGQLLNLLVKESKARSILELGTSYGYSAVWMAEAVRITGGKVHTLELSAEKSAFAGDKLASVGLASYVERHVGDALEILRRLPGPFDFVLVDLWKDLYVPCFDLFLPKLSPGALVVADNMLFPVEVRAEAETYRRHVRESGRFDSVLLPVGSGIEVSRLR